MPSPSMNIFIKKRKASQSKGMFRFVESGCKVISLFTVLFHMFEMFCKNKYNDIRLCVVAHLGTLRQVDHLRPGIQDQAAQQGKIPSLLKIQN